MIDHRDLHLSIRRQRQMCIRDRGYMISLKHFNKILDVSVAHDVQVLACFLVILAVGHVSRLVDD